MQQGSALEDGRHGPCHHLQGQAQNSEQMGEQGVCGGVASLPEPTSICGMWEGHSSTLHRNYLLPISNNLEQEAGDNSVEGDGPSVEPIPVPHENDALMVNCPTKS